MIKRKLHIPIRELNKVLLRELIGLNNMKVKKGTFYFNDVKLDFNNLSVKVIPSEPNRLEKLFIKMDDNLLVEIEEALKNENSEVIMNLESDYIDSDLEMRKISFNGITFVIMLGII